MCVCALISSYKHISHSRLGPPSWPHLNLITSVKTLSPSIVIFWDPGGEDFHEWLGAGGHWVNTAHDAERGRRPPGGAEPVSQPEIKVPLEHFLRGCTCCRGRYRNLSIFTCSVCKPHCDLVIDIICFNWSIIALQCCLSFCCIMKWISYIYIYPLLLEPSTHPPPRSS